MKNILIVFILTIFVCKLNAQIALEKKYPITSGGYDTKLYLNKFQVSGYKYVQNDLQNLKIRIYNLNHSLFKTINIPNLGFTNCNVSYISENLFDSDNSMEYIANAFFSSGNNTLYVLNEDGSIVFQKDSASLGYASSIVAYPTTDIEDPIFYDGTSTKMRVVISYATTDYRYEIYSLPGSMPCISCNSGTLAGISSNSNPEVETAKFFPNPTSGQLKLKYKLPDGSHSAEMKIYDMQGKLVEEFKVTDTFDFIYLPTNFNNGLYLYSLIVDGKIVKTEKIVLNK